MEQSGKVLTMTGNEIWKGSVSHNGTLLKLHDFSFTVGFSKLVTATNVPARFGFGVWYDAARRDNTVYTYAPTGAGAVPVFAGILVRNPAIASGYPAQNDIVDTYNKALIVKEGFVVFKTGYNGADESLRFNDIQVGMGLYVNDTNGRFTFSETAPDGHTLAGKVILLNPDDQSWTVKVSV